MVTVLVTSFLLLVVISFAIYRWQRVASGETVNRTLPPPPDFQGLFADSLTAEQARLNAAQLDNDLKEKRRELLVRAESGDKEVLPEAHNTGDKKLYEEILNALVLRAENDKQVLALASYIKRSAVRLKINTTLAEAFTKVWTKAPERNTTAGMLHVVALAGEPTLYQQTVEQVLQHWRDKLLSNMTAEEVVTLIESEFWLIPSSARNSGTGFLLKRELAKIRRELLRT
jgi:hypothetical protein